MSFSVLSVLFDQPKSIELAIQASLIFLLRLNFLGRFWLAIGIVLFGLFFAVLVELIKYEYDQHRVVL